MFYLDYLYDLNVSCLTVLTQVLYMEYSGGEGSWFGVLELLYIPIIVIIWIDSFLKLLTRLPTTHSLQVTNA